MPRAAGWGGSGWEQKQPKAWESILRSWIFSPKTCQHGPQNPQIRDQDLQKWRPRPFKIEASTVQNGVGKQDHLPNSSLRPQGKFLDDILLDLGVSWRPNLLEQPMEFQHS